MAQKFNPLSGNFDLVLDKASEIKYDNSTSGLTSTTVQTALDEVQSNIDSIPDPITYVGTWDASTNTPTLSNADGRAHGSLFQVTVAGTVDFGAGPITFDVNDKVVKNASNVYEKWDQTDAVTSVNGYVGAVVLTSTDVAEGTNQYFTNERAQDAVGAALTTTSTVALSYNDPSNTIAADVVDGSITDTKLATVNSNVGSFGSASQSLSATVNAKGLVTAISSQSIQITEAQVTNLTTDLASKVDKVAGNITKTSFTAANNVSTPTNVTGAAFANGVTRSFEMEVDVILSATTPAYQNFTMRGIQRGSDWVMTQISVGDNAGVVFSITAAGQLQYISANAPGFTSLTINFKASTLGI